MEKKQFLKNSFTLMVSSGFTGAVNFAFSVLLSRKLGSEGLGLYGLVMPIYTLMICFISEGIIPSMSKNIQIQYQKQSFLDIKKTTRLMIRLMLIWSVFIAALLFLTAQFISVYLIKDPRALFSLQVLCPALIFVSISAVLKGFFFGIEQFKTPAIIDIVEKIVRITFLWISLYNFSSAHIGHSVAITYFILTCGEFASFILLYIFYQKTRKSFPVTQQLSHRKSQLLSRILVVSLPIGVNGILSSIFHTLASLILPRILIRSGMRYPEALSAIGEFNGMALSIATFPLILLNSVTAVLIPDMASQFAAQKHSLIHRRIVKVLKISLYIGLGNLLFLWLLPQDLGNLFFHTSKIDQYIRFCSILSLITFITIPSIAILNGLGKQGIVLRNSLTGTILLFSLIITLPQLYQLQMIGYFLSLGFSTLTVCLLNLKHIHQMYPFKISFRETCGILFIGWFTYKFLDFLQYAIPSFMIQFKIPLIALVTIFLVWSIYNLFERRCTKRNKR